MSTQTIPRFVRLPSTREDREELLAFVHRAKRPGKTPAQTRSNDRRRAIRESQDS